MLMVYNGLESNLTDKEVADHLSNLDEKRMKAEIQRAEKEADITVIMPQMVLNIVWNRQMNRLNSIIR